MCGKRRCDFYHIKKPPREDGFCYIELIYFNQSAKASRYFSASSAAIQPEPAEVMA